MSNQEGILAEYSTLRQELIQSMQMNLQVSVAALPIAAGVIAYGFQSLNSIAFLAVIIVLLSALWYTAASTGNMINVASYLYAIVEPKIEELKWETIVVAKRKREKINSLMSGTLTTITIYAFISLGSIFFAWRFLQDRSASNLTIYFCMTLALLIMFIVVSVYAIRCTSIKYYIERSREWEQIEKSISSSAIAVSDNHIIK